MTVFRLSNVSLRTRFVIGMGLTLVPLVLVAAGATLALERSLGHVHDVVEEGSEELAVLLRLQILLERANSAIQVCANLHPGPCEGFRRSRHTVDAAFEGAAAAPFGMPEERALLNSAREQWRRAGDISESMLIPPDLRSVSAEIEAVGTHIHRAIEMLEGAHSLSLWEMASSLTSVQGTRRRTRLLIVIMFALGVAIAGASATMLARSVLNPIHALEHGARRFAAGQLTYRVVPSTYTELAHLGTTFNAMAETLEKSRAALVNSSVRDGLTDVYNHREFKRYLAVKLERWRGHREPFDMLLLDIDRFKNINDTCGHQAGDDVLRRVAGELIEAVRPTDFVARYGGDEFVLLLQRTSPARTVAIAERIRSVVAAAPADVSTASPPVTVSIGIAGCPDDAQSGPDLIRKADDALYEAKRMGGNQARSAAIDDLMIIS